MNNPSLADRVGLRTSEFAWRMICLAAQAATVAITWDLWLARHSPPNLPSWEILGRISYGWPLILSLCLVLPFPRIGTGIHAAVLITAIAADQFRLQPQFLAIGLLLAATTERRIERIARWYLVSMWGWAGIHKWISIQWWEDSTWSLLAQAGWNPDGVTFAFGVATVAAELILAGLAACRPKQAAALCALIHLGIVLLFSPWLANRNYSVIPWNLLLASYGTRILWRADSGPRFPWEPAIALLLLGYPVLYYAGWIDRGLAHVLYAGNVPRGFAVHQNSLREIDGWGSLSVPFPAQHRLLTQYFERTAEPGDRLRIAEPRWANADRYFVLEADRRVRELSPQHPEFARWFGVGRIPDDPAAITGLTSFGVQLLKRSDDSMIYAARVSPEHFHPRILTLLARLPNLEQLQVSGCNLGDEHLAALLRLSQLKGIGVARTRLTLLSIERLRQMPRMEAVETLD